MTLIHFLHNSVYCSHFSCYTHKISDVVPSGFFQVFLFYSVSFRNFSLYSLSITVKMRTIVRIVYSPIGWGCRIHRLHLYRMVRPHHQQVSRIWHLSNLMVRLQVMPELWQVQSTPSLPSLPGSLWLREVSQVIYI